MNRPELKSFRDNALAFLGRIAAHLYGGPKLILAFLVTLALFLAGLVAVNVVFPVILAALGALILYNSGKGGVFREYRAKERIEMEKEIEVVQLQSVCADMVQHMSRCGGSSSFSELKNHLESEDADFKTALEASSELGWIELNYGNERAFVTSKGLEESRKYLKWLGVMK